MFQPGDVVDERYDIMGPLGQGGMAQVFKAQDRHLDRPVALKVLRPHLTDADSERFRREIRTLAKLSHPGVVSIFDMGLGEHVYFTMELIEGGPFTDLGPLEPDPEPQRRLLAAAITVAEALGYVHRLGMVHRDLTPRNILLSAQGKPKVMDFGLVQLTESSRQLTRTGITLGTPQYMAPEQATGETTGAATDLYAFGAVLYRAVTGVAPFDADNDQAVLYQHVYGSVTPPHELNPAVPDDLSALILRLLQKNPTARPVSGFAVADALRAVLAEGERRAVGMPGGGPARRGVLPHGPLPGPLQLRWQRELDEGPQWPAGLAAGAGFLFAGLRSDALAVLRPADGGLHATFPTVDEVSASPLLQRDRLWVVSRDGTLQAIGWPRGETLWRDEERDVVGVAGHGSRLLLSSRRGQLTLIDAHGAESWCYRADAPLVTPPVIHCGEAFAVAEDGWLHAVDAATGSGRFKVQLGPVVAAPCAADHTLLLCERSGALHGFDLRLRDVRWTYDLDGEVWATPAAWEGRVFAASWGEVVRCLSLKSGDDLWEQPVHAPVTAPPVIAAGVLFVATEGGELFAFDARSGRRLFRHQVTHAPIQAAPLPLGESLVVAALDGTLAAFG